MSTLPSRWFPRGLAIGLVAGLGFIAPANAQRPGDDEVVGRVGTAEVKLGQVRDFLRGLDAPSRQQAEKDPQILARLVRGELERLAVLAEARDKKFEQRPEIQALLARAREQALVSSYMQSVVQ